MKIKLNLQERLVFGSLLPLEQNFSTLKIIRKAKEIVGITDAEFKEFKIKPAEEGRISFDPEKSLVEKEFEINEVAVQLVKESLEKLDKDKKLVQEQFPLYEKLFS